MTLKEFWVKIGLKADTAEFKKFDQLISGVGKALTAFAAAGAAAGAAIGAVALSTAHDAAEIQKLATILGVSTQSAQEWAYAAKKSGVDVGDMIELSAELAENIGEASGGTGEAADAFKSLGLSLKDSQGKLKQTPDMLLEISDKMSAMRDGQAKTAAITGLFGESGIRLVGVLNKGSEAIKGLAVEANDLGLIMNETQIKQGAEATKNWETFLSILNAVKNSVAGPILASLNDLAKVAFSYWIVNKNLIKQRADKFFKALGAILKPLLYVFMGLFKAAGFVLDNFKGLAAFMSSFMIAAILLNVGGIKTLIASYITAATTATSAGYAMARAWLIANGPLIAGALLLASMVIFAQDLYGWMRGDKSLIGELLGDWDDFSKKFTDPIEFSDPAWLKVLKTGVETVRTLLRLWNEFAQKLSVEIDTDFAGDMFKARSSLYKGIEAKIGKDGAAALWDMSFGGGASPGASAGTKAGSVKPTPGKAPITLSPTINIQVDGSKDPEATGQTVYDKAKEYVDSQLRELMEGVH